MEYETTGIIEAIKPEQQFKKGFRKQEIIVIPGDDDRNVLPMEFHGDSIDLVDDLRIRQRIRVKFEPKGREWNGRHFINLVVTDVESLDEGTGGGTPDGPPPAEDTGAGTGNTIPEDDDIPF